MDADIEGEDSCISTVVDAFKAAFGGASPTFTVMALFLGLVMGIVGLALQASFASQKNSDAVSSLRLTISEETTYAWNLLYAVAIAIGVYPLANAANYIFLGTLRQLLFSRFFVVVLYVGAFDNGPLTTIIWAVSASEVAPRLAGLPSLGSLGTRLLVLFLVIGLVTGLKNLMVAVLQGRTILDQFTAKVRDAVQQLVVLQNLSAAAVVVATKRARLLKRFHAAQQRARAVEATSGSDSASPLHQHRSPPHTAVHVPVTDLDERSMRSVELPVSMPLQTGTAQSPPPTPPSSPAVVNATPPFSPAAAFANSDPNSFLRFAPQATRVGLGSHSMSHAAMTSRPAPGSNLLQAEVGDPHALPPLMEEASESGSSPVRRSARAPTLQDGELLAVVGQDGLLCTVPLHSTSADLSAAAGLSHMDADGATVEDSDAASHASAEIARGLTVSIQPAALGAVGSGPMGVGMGSVSSAGAAPTSRPMPVVVSSVDGSLGWLPPVPSSQPTTSAGRPAMSLPQTSCSRGAASGALWAPAVSTGYTTQPGHAAQGDEREGSVPVAATEEELLFNSGSQSPSNEPDVADLRDFESEEENYAVLSQYIEAGHFSLFDGKGRIVAIRNAAHAKRIVSGLFSALDIQNAGKIAREQLTWDGDGWSEPLGPGWSDESVEGAFAGIGADNALFFTRADLLLFTEAAVTGFQSLRGTLNSFTAVTRALDMIADAVLYIVFIIFGVLLFDIDVQPVLISIGTVLVSLGFAISGPASNVVESLIFLLVTRPYELGDRVRFDNGPPLYVRKIDLYTTTFERLDGTHATYRNALLASREMRNEKRSGYAVVAVAMDIALDATPAQLEALNGAVVGYIRDRPMAWRSGIIEFYVYSIHPERNSMTVAFWLKHRLPYQQCVTVFADVGSFLLFVASTLRNLRVDYRMPKQPIEIVGGEGGHLTGQRWAPDAPDSSNGMEGPSPIASLLNGGSTQGGPLRPSGTPPLAAPPPLNQFAQQAPPHMMTAPQSLPWSRQPAPYRQPSGASTENSIPEPVRLDQPQVIGTSQMPFSQVSSAGYVPTQAQMNPYPLGPFGPLYATGQTALQAAAVPAHQYLQPSQYMVPQPGMQPFPLQPPAQLVAAESAAKQWQDIRTGSIAHLWRPEHRFFVPVVSAGMTPTAVDSGESYTPQPAAVAYQQPFTMQPVPAMVNHPAMWSASWPMQAHANPAAYATVPAPAAHLAGLPIARPPTAQSAPVTAGAGMTKSASAGSLGSGSIAAPGAVASGENIAHRRNASDTDLHLKLERGGGSGSVSREVTGGTAPTATKPRRIELSHTVGNFGGIQLKPQTERQRQQQEKVKARQKALGAAKQAKGKKSATFAGAGGDSASAEGGSLGRGDNIFGRSRSWGKDHQATVSGPNKARNKSVLWALRQGEAWERGSTDVGAPERATRSSSMSNQPIGVSRSTDNLAQLAAAADVEDDSKSQ